MLLDEDAKYYATIRKLQDEVVRTIMASTRTCLKTLTVEQVNSIRDAVGAAYNRRVETEKSDE